MPKKGFLRQSVPWLLLLLFAVVLLQLFGYAAARFPLNYVNDEGFYLYDAWIKYHAPTSASTCAMCTNFGFVTGVPYLFKFEPGVFGLRMFSMVIWTLGFSVFLYGYLKPERKTWLILPLLGAYVAHINTFSPTLDYHTVPLLAIASAGGIFLLASGGNNTRTQLIQGFLISFLACIAVLGNTAMIIASSFVLLMSGLIIRQKQFHVGLGLGLFVGIVLLIILTPLNPFGLLEFIDSNYQGANLGGSHADTRNLLSTAINRLGSLLIFITKVFDWRFYLAFFCIALVTFPFQKLVAQQSSSTFLNKRITWQLIGLGLILLALGLSWPSSQTFHLLWVFTLVPLVGILVIASAPKERKLIAMVPVLWLILVYLTEYGIGNNMPQIYLVYFTPFIVGLTLLGSILFTTRAELSIQYKGIFYAFIGIVLAFYLKEPLSEWGHLRNFQSPIHHPKFRNSLATTDVANNLNQIAQLYQQYGCNKRFFASLDYLPLFYFMFNRPSPFKGFDLERLPQQRDILHAQDSMCVIHRVTTTEAEQHELEAYLGISPKTNNFIHHHIGKDLGFLVIDRHKTESQAN